MINKITHVTLYVNDQDEAVNFYKDKLGMQVHTDAPMEDMRWLTMTPAGQTDFELVLMPAKSAATQSLVGKQSPDAPFICVSTEDCVRDVTDLKAKGVTFVQEAKVEPWGTSAMFLDLYGNMIYLVQAPV